MNGKDAAARYGVLGIRDRPYFPYESRSYNKVLVVMDVPNIIARMNRDYPGRDLDYRKLLIDIVGSRDCVAAIAIDGSYSDDEERHTRIQCAISDSGFRVEVVHATNNYGKQDGTDVKLALTAFKYVFARKCDRVVLITGDGDFSVLVDELHEQGAVVEVMSFDESLSNCLKRKADKVSIIDDMPLARMKPVEDEEASL